MWNGQYIFFRQFFLTKIVLHAWTLPWYRAAPYCTSPAVSSTLLLLLFLLQLQQPLATLTSETNSILVVLVEAQTHAPLSKKKVLFKSLSMHILLHALLSTACIAHTEVSVIGFGTSLHTAELRVSSKRIITAFPSSWGGDLGAGEALCTCRIKALFPPLFHVNPFCQ